MKSCSYCDRVIENKGSLAAHQKACLKNPNRISQIRSPNAGAQAGNVPWNKGKKIALTEYQLSTRKLDSDVFVVDSTYARHLLKARILKQDLVEYKCSCCGTGPEWFGKPMPLILDHINGVNNDNRLENLRFVCSNCDTQLPTYKSKNKKKMDVCDDGVEQS